MCRYKALRVQEARKQVPIAMLGNHKVVLISPAPITTVETGQTTTSPLAMYMEAEKCNGGLAGGAVQSNSGDCLDCEVDKQTPGFEIIIRDTDERH